MKTTVDIAEPLLQAVKALAARERTTLRSLVEEGLRRVVAEHEASGGFEMRDASVAGEGLQAPLLEGDWSSIRALAYEGRGT